MHGKPEDHLVDINKMVDLGLGSQLEVSDTMLSRRCARYLIAQNGDPIKPEIAFAQKPTSPFKTAAPN